MLPKLLYTKAEAATVLFCTVRTIERHIERGALRSLKVGRYRCIPRSELEAFIAAQVA
jgi:excisionase family DNA binding protein